MFVSKETAQAIVEEMKAATGHDINLMDDQGVILASTDPKRVGEEHGGAKRLLSQGLQRLVVYDDEEPGTRKGVNLPVYMEGTPVGVIGITGAPDGGSGPGQPGDPAHDPDHDEKCPAHGAGEPAGAGPPGLY